MKILLDECIDRRLGKELKGHAVKTVPQMGWATIKNGQLLALAEKEFDIFVTVDRNLSFQQNLPKFKIAVAGVGRPDKPSRRFEAPRSENIESVPATQAGLRNKSFVTPQKSEKSDQTMECRLIYSYGDCMLLTD